MRKLYETLDDLREKCEEYFKQTELVAPRSFRIHLGLGKDLLSKWRTMQPDYFNLVKEYEDKILAKVEEYVIYGETHPVIRNQLLVIETYQKFEKGQVVGQSETPKMAGKFNQVGALFTLRSYDKDLYMPEMTQAMKDVEKKEPIVVQFQNTSGHKLDVLEAKVVEKDAAK